MIPKRLLFTGYATAHVVRHASYAIELGATILHVGYAPLFPTNPPSAYTFVPIAEQTTTEMRLLGISRPEYEEVVPIEGARLAEIAKRFQPDLCHAVGMDLTFHLAVQAELHPLLVSAHGFLEHLIYKQPVLTWKDEPLLRADALIVEPPMLVELMRSLLPETVQLHEFAIGLNGRHYAPADAATRAKLRRAMQLPPEATVILSARGLGPTYNHDLILAAFAQALPQLPAPVYLLFVKMGRSGDSTKSFAYLETLQQQAQNLGVADHIRWLPTFPEMTLPSLYNAADLVLSYRTPDTFGNTVLEVMACERPIIVPDLPTYPASVIAEHARRVPPKDVDALAAAIIEMVQNPPTAEARTAGRQAVLARYDKPVVMQQLETIYNSVMTQAQQNSQSLP